MIPSSPQRRVFARTSNRRRAAPKSGCGGATERAAGAAVHEGVGRCSEGRGAEAGGGTSQPGASDAGAASAAVAGACHAAGGAGAAFVSGAAALPRAVARAGVVAQGGVSGRSFLRADGSPPLAGRGGHAGGARARRAGARGSVREGHQSSRASAWAGLGQPLPRAPPANTARGAARARLRPSELSEAPPRGAGRGSAQLGGLVRRVALPDPTAARAEPGPPAAHLARGRGVAAASGRHRARRTPGEFARARQYGNPGTGSSAE
jgi:hypothetical protein